MRIAARRKHERILNDVRPRSGSDVFTAQCARQRINLIICIKLVSNFCDEQKGGTRLFAIDARFRNQPINRRLHSVFTALPNGIRSDAIDQLSCLAGRSLVKQRVIGFNTERVRNQPL